jgi:acyl-CoA thioesterase II
MDTEQAARALVGVEPDGEEWVGRAPAWSREVVFGGVLMGQTVSAATSASVDGRRIHSIHMYFLRPARAELPIRYRVSVLRDGKSFMTCRVGAHQDGKDILTALCSFTADGEAYEYEQPTARDAPGPSSPNKMFDMWLSSYVGPTPPADDGTFASTSRMWVRTDGALPKDPDLHAALIAFVSDWTWTGGRPLHLDGDTRGMISLDHAIWFHREARADEWLYYDVESLINANGRGLLRGKIHGEDRAMCASVAQEMKLLRYEDAPAR